MQVADMMRRAQRDKLRRMEAEGFNQRTVEMVILESVSGDDPVAQVSGTRKETHYKLKPNPVVVMNRRESLSAFGTPLVSDVDLKGAYPAVLDGYLYTDGVKGKPVEKIYSTANEFIQDLMNTQHFLVDGEKYAFASRIEGGGGSIREDKFQREWMVRLVKV